MNNLSNQVTHLNNEIINIVNSQNKNIGNIVNEFNKLLDINNKDLAFLYIRTSKKQNVENVSIDVQQLELLNFCYKNNFYVNNIFIDNGKSAKNMKNQTELSKLNRVIKRELKLKNYDNYHFIVYDVSRLSRNIISGLTFLDNLSKLNVNIYMLREGINYNSPQNKHFIRINLSTSQFLSEYSSCRVKQSVNFKRQRGEHIGKIPYGFCKDVNGKLIINKKEFNCIKYIYKQKNNLYVSGSNKFNSGVGRILKTLNKKYPCGFKGRDFNKNHLKLCLKRYDEIMNNSCQYVSAESLM